MLKIISSRGIGGNSPDLYRVVTVGQSCIKSGETMEIYHSMEKSSQFLMLSNVKRGCPIFFEPETMGKTDDSNKRILTTQKW